MSGSVVVDTSIAIKWVVAEPDSALAQALLQGWLNSGFTVIAPTLFASEVVNVLFKRVRRSLNTTDEAKKRLEHLLLRGPALIFDDADTNLALMTRALELAGQHSLPATYDAHFLALAEREGCEYWTADERLWNSVKDKVPWVRWLGEFTPAP